ncbi:hypothetical protein ACRALDRAFT_1093097 [Sodiomyces alcalophilus JCM 7366]|uniref:uncharacterized protein n=1 Tax=Sodiomyces alcalophilus JCM 7366 TaxID=591952 RepID=UPI0039B5EBB7
MVLKEENALLYPKRYKAKANAGLFSCDQATCLETFFPSNFSSSIMRPAYPTNLNLPYFEHPSHSNLVHIKLPANFPHEENGPLELSSSIHHAASHFMGFTHSPSCLHTSFGLCFGPNLGEGKGGSETTAARWLPVATYLYLWFGSLCSPDFILRIIIFVHPTVSNLTFPCVRSMKLAEDGQFLSFLPAGGLPNSQHSNSRGCLSSPSYFPSFLSFRLLAVVSLIRYILATFLNYELGRQLHSIQVQWRLSHMLRGVTQTIGNRGTGHLNSA